MNRTQISLTVIAMTVLILLLAWLSAITSFNPITNASDIKNIKSIITKLENYEAKTPLSDDEFERYFDYIDLTEEELLIIEPRGLKIVREGNSYQAILPTGFDTNQYYDRTQDCWYGHKAIIGLKKCHK